MKKLNKIIIKKLNDPFVIQVGEGNNKLILNVQLESMEREICGDVTYNFTCHKEGEIKKPKIKWYYE